jgi:hypothetical protein
MKINSTSLFADPSVGLPLLTERSNLENEHSGKDKVSFLYTICISTEKSTSVWEPNIMFSFLKIGMMNVWVPC